MATTHLFLNDFHDPPALAAAIAASGLLQCVCLLECTLNRPVLAALAAKGAGLRGVELYGCPGLDDGETSPGRHCHFDRK